MSLDRFEFGSQSVWIAMSNHPNSKPESDSNDERSQSILLPKVIKFSELVRCGDEIWIEHLGQLYRLRKTKQDKLILTK